MNTLTIGLTAFLGIHLLPMFTPLRQGLVESLGENLYKGLFSMVSLVGLGLIVWGFSQSPFIHVYVPPAWGRSVVMATVPLAMILVVAANMPSHIRSRLKHPMLIGILLWAGSHLLVNGDFRAVMLFGSFAAYALVDLLSVLARDKTLIGDRKPAWTWDILAIVVGLILSAGLIYAHGRLFGMAILY